MKEMTNLERWRDVSVIEKRHTPIDIGAESFTICSRCEAVWPCDTRRMVEHLGALTLQSIPQMVIAAPKRRWLGGPR